MQLHDLKPEQGSKKRKTRIARGIGSGLGKTAGRGTKGQKARRQVHPNFEGGQTPIHRRLPVKKGFRNINKTEYAVLNVASLEEAFEKGGELSPETARSMGLVGNMKDGLKILGNGNLTRKVKVSAHAFSKSAEQKIIAAGGEVIRL